MVSVQINFIGVGCLVINHRNSNNLFSKLTSTARSLKTTLEEALFDADFFKKLKNRKYKSIKDLGNIDKAYGLLNHQKSFVEIRINGRKKLNIYFSDLEKNDKLFPDYNVNFETIDIDKSEYFTLTESYVGLINSYRFVTDKLDLLKLQFFIHEINCSSGLQYKVLNSIKYENTLIKKPHTDCVVTGQYAKLVSTSAA